MQTDHPTALDRSDDRPSGWVHRSTYAYLASWLGLWLLYLATAVGNRSETDDAFAFALAVERSPWATLVASEHLPHLLFLPLWRGLYELARVFIPDVSAYDVMRFVDSGLAAAAVVWFVVLLHRRFDTSIRAAALAGGGLAVSYGFWRYANESDAYPLAAVFAVALCWLVLARNMRPTLAAWAAGVGVVGALFHILLLVPLLVLGPSVFVLGRRWRCLGVYSMTGVLLLLASVGAIYGIGRASGQSFVAYVGSAGGASVTASSAARVPVGLGPNFVAMNAAFAYEPFVDRLRALAPTMEVDEEVYAAERAPLAARVAPVTFIVVVALGLALLALAIPGWRSRTRVRLLPVGLWALVLAFVILGRSSTTPEAWLPIMIPAWILIGVGVFDRVPKGANVVILTFVLVLAAHNLVGGMLVMRTPRNDLNARRAEWLLSNAGEGDVVLAAEGSTFERYLSYRTRADVVPLRYLDGPALHERYTTATRGAENVYATEGVFMPADEYCAQSRPLCEDLREFGLKVREDFSAVDLPAPQRVFRWEPGDLRPAG